MIHAPAVIELLRVRLALVEPMVSAHGEEATRDLVIVRVVDRDGQEGWGECSALERPTYTSEYTDGAWAVLRDLLGPMAIAGTEGDVVGHPMARAALATAQLDARLRGAGRSLAAHLGTRAGRPRRTVPTTAVVGRHGDVDALLAAVDARRAEGAAVIKVKVTPHPIDLEGIAAVRRTWPDLTLAADANGSLDARSASILDGLDLLYLEQPAPADDLVASAGFARRLGTPIALDESVTSAASLDAAVALGAAGIVNVKAARLGGVDQAVDVILRASEHGLAAFCGGMLETGIGRAAALAVAALPGLGLPTDLGPSSRYLAHDLTAPFDLDASGCLTVPEGPGIGVVPDRDLIDAACVDRWVLLG